MARSQPLSIKSMPSVQTADRQSAYKRRSFVLQDMAFQTPVDGLRHGKRRPAGCRDVASLYIICGKTDRNMSIFIATNAVLYLLKSLFRRKTVTFST